MVLRLDEGAQLGGRDGRGRLWRLRCGLLRCRRWRCGWWFVGRRDEVGHVEFRVGARVGMVEVVQMVVSKRRRKRGGGRRVGNWV